MKKLALIAFATTTICTSAFAAVTSTAKSADLADQNFLDHVPSDTLFFMGTETPFPIDLITQQFPAEYYSAQMPQIKEDIVEMEELTKQSPAAKMFFALYLDYIDTMSKPDALLDRYGVGEYVSSAAYTIGLIPVLRHSVADPEAFIGTLVELEKQYDINTEISEQHGFNIREYQYSDNDQFENLLIATSKTEVVIALQLPVATDYLPQILGVKAPQTPLSKSNKLSDIRKRHDLDPRLLGYLDHQLIIEAITSPKTSQAGEMLNSLIAQFSDEKAPFAKIQTPACQKEIADIASRWPLSAFGYKSIDYTGNPVEIVSKFVFESTNESFLSDLMKLRGFIPSAVQAPRNDAIFNLAWGIEIDQVLPVLNKIWTENNNAKYECPALQDMQASIKEMNPMAAGMVFGMASGISGISLNLFDIAYDITYEEVEVPVVEGDETSTDATADSAAADAAESETADSAPKTKVIRIPDVNVTNIDFSMTLSGRNARVFLGSISAMVPNIPSLNLPENGDAISFTLPIPNGPELEIFAAAKGDHAIIYSGTNATKTVAEFTQDKLSQNGSFVMSVNYQRYMNHLFELVQFASPTLDQPETMEFKEIKTPMLMHLIYDTTKSGIEMESIMEIYEPEASMKTEKK